VAYTRFWWGNLKETDHLGHVARIGVKRGVYRILVGKPEEKRPLGRPRRRRDKNIKMDLRKWDGG
jgi:hypothetical protein